MKVVNGAAWKSFAEVRMSLRSADYVKDLVIFDIGGNNYRLVCEIDYSLQRVYVAEMMTHSEYDRWKV